MKDRIHLIRAENKLSMQAFGERIGISREAVRLIENGTSKPTDRTLRDICKEFKINKEWLITGAGDKDAPQPTNKSLDALAEAHQINGITRAIIEGLIAMKPELQLAFAQLIEDVAEKVRNAEYEQITAEQVAASLRGNFNLARAQSLPAADHEDSSETHTK